MSCGKGIKIKGFTQILSVECRKLLKREKVYCGMQNREMRFLIVSWDWPK